MAYRDVGSLLARLDVLEARCLRVRARAKRFAQLRTKRRLRLLVRTIVAAVLLLFALTAFVLVDASRGYRREVMRNAAEHDTATLQEAATHWRENYAASSCPTLEGLVRDKELSPASKLTDPWDLRYELRCEGATVLAMSAGPDGRFGTEDDISR